MKSREFTLAQETEFVEMTFRNMVWYYRKELSRFGPRGRCLRTINLRDCEIANLKRQNIIERHHRIKRGFGSTKIYKLSEKAKAELLRQKAQFKNQIEIPLST